MLLTICFSLFAPGCAELAQTARIFNVALMELFRLPIYLMRIPAELIQHIGPMMQAAARSAANLAPLLLFIENTAPRDTLYAGSPEDALDRAVSKAMGSEDAAPLLSVMEKETGNGGGARFILVDSRCLRIPALKKAILETLSARGAAVSCRLVKADGIFDEKERFLGICGRMRDRGDILFAATPFNDYIASITGNSADSLPSAPEERAFMLRWSRLLEGREGIANYKL